MKSQFNTPVLLIIFNRPTTTQKVFNQIKLIKPTYLYVAADGPRIGKIGEVEKCLETRNIIQQVDWDCELKTFFRDENSGCGIAVSSALTWFFKNVEEGIILEDDCLPDLSFFYYCQQLLEKYKNDENIFLICGSNFQTSANKTEGSYYFSNYGNIWGWASWSRAWKNYNYDLDDLEEVVSGGAINHVFQNKNEKKYWLNVLAKTKQKKMNTWDYQWFYTIWKNKGLAITPNVNLVKNIGFYEESTHFFLKDSYRDNHQLNNMEFPLIHPPQIINSKADKSYFNNILSHSLIRISRLIKENGVLFLVRILSKRYFNN